MTKPAVRPVRWQPPARSTDPSGPIPALRTYPVPGVGPEDVLVDASGRVLTGVADGRVLRLDPGTGRYRQVVETGGRPLGLEWLPDGRLLICDAHRGLLAADLTDTDTGPPATVTDGRLEVLVTEVAGRPVRLCNNAAVGPDGTIWFTDSSARFDLDHWKADLIEHSGTGRLIRRDPDGHTAEVVTGLQFGNGVALAADGRAVYYAETGDYSLNKVPLTGPRAGLPTKLTPALPGFPDNISTGTDGRIWVAIASPRNALLDRLAPAPPALRSAVWALPDKLQPKPVNLTCVLAVDPATDRIVAAHATRNPAFGVSTGVREHHGTVWLGSLTATTIAAFDLGG